MSNNKAISTPKTCTKYKPEYCDDIIKHLSEGYSVESFAGVLGVDRGTIYNWLRDHEEFREAKQIADQKSRLWAESQLKQQIEGKLKANPIPILFYLKNRFPNEWRDRKEIVQEKEATEDVSTLSIEEKLEKLEQLRVQLLAQLHKSTPSKAIEIEAVSRE